MKSVSSHTKEYVDAETGETLGSETKKYQVLVKSDAEFCIMYSRLTTALTDLDYSEAKVLVWCSMHTALNTNEVCLPKLIKERLAADMQLNVRTVDNALQKLVKKGYFKRLGTGIYHVDPDLSWRGSKDTHTRNVQVFLDYAKPKKPAK